MSVNGFGEPKKFFLGLDAPLSESSGQGNGAVPPSLSCLHALMPCGIELVVCETLLGTEGGVGTFP